jgi:hypothetical protein
MTQIEDSPLGQALAAIIALLIAALAETAREQPLLAGGCRAAIRQLEQTSKRFQALANEWHAARSPIPTSRAGFSPPGRPGVTPPRPTPHPALTPPRRRDHSSPRGPIARAHRAAARAPPTPGVRRSREKTPPGTPRPGAAPMYAYPCRSNTTAPPRIVMSARVAKSSSAPPAKMSRDRIATSANCPGTSLPRLASANWV